MSAKRPIRYQDAGVNIDEADRATAKIKKLAQATFNKNVLAGVGAFGACYSLAGEKLKDPVLISSADGVGTKLHVAFSMGVHDTVGQCLVNHCVNDIAVQGARPIFFLDYFATGELEADVAEQVVSGFSKACQENGCALIGGETAEMPGMYRKGEYDLAGFIVGVAERKKLLTPDMVAVGDVLIGLPSTGLHTNGYSLARKLLFETAGLSVAKKHPMLERTVGEELLQIHRSYLKPLTMLHDAGLLHGAAHITGGGITDNTPRILPAGVEARVDLKAWTPPPIFELMREIGNVDVLEMLRTFNMGVGMIFVVPGAKRKQAIEKLEKAGEMPIVLGEVAKQRAAKAKAKVVYSE
ncbi:MAG: phosphoribosylformylglycinamidine cyclo-ligase [Bryobacterales bacterium]